MSGERIIGPLVIQWWRPGNPPIRKHWWGVAVTLRLPHRIDVTFELASNPHRRKEK